jgi:hypothetical protein
MIFPLRMRRAFGASLKQFTRPAIADGAARLPPLNCQDTLRPRQARKTKLSNTLISLVF